MEKKLFLPLLLMVCFLTSNGQEAGSAEDQNGDPKTDEAVTNGDEPKSFTIDPVGSEGERMVEKEVIDIDDFEEEESIEVPEQEEVPVEEVKEPENPEIPEKPKNGRQAKKSDRDDGIQTLARKGSHNGGFGALSFKATEFNEQDMVLAGLRGGWIFNRSLAIGLEAYGIIPTAEYQVTDRITLVETRAVGGYGGLFLEPIIFSNQVVHITFPVSAGSGWIGYVLDWEDNPGNDENDLVDGDVFWYVEPGASIEINVAKNFRVNLGATRRFLQDFTLQDTSGDAFDNWSYLLTLKFGRF